MSRITSSYKKSLIDEMVNNISANLSHYYAVAANPVAITNTAVEVANNDLEIDFNTNWTAIFGKKLLAGDIAYMIDKKSWLSNTVYNRYDNTVENLSNYYVISNPAFIGGEYLVYKCIDNANGAPSTVDPATVGSPKQPTTFITSPDNYRWRYIGNIPAEPYINFATDSYVPIYADDEIVSTASQYAGVEVVMISNSGIGYSCYANGVVLSNPNTTLIQIENDSSQDDDFYTKSGIYIYNTGGASQLFGITRYVSNSTGRWVFLDSQANTSDILPSVTQYFISPRVVFETDGDYQPKAYSTINTTSNSIQSVIMLDSGSNISWANVHIQSNTNYGSGANLYAIVPPPGGHGSEPATELGVKAMGITFSFANNESQTIVTSNVVYNKIGVMKNPYNMYSNGAKSSSRYWGNTFSNVLEANVSPAYTFNVGETVTGANSGSKGIVIFSNTTTVFIAGDKTFQNNEALANSSGSNATNITITTLGDVYTKDTKPLYVKNINNVNRSNNQTETFKLIIQI